MTPSLRFMRQRTCLTRTLTRNPYLIGYTRHICHTRTLTCDPYQIGSNPARHSCPTGTLTHVLVQIRTVMGHIVTRGPSPTTPSSGQSMGQRMPGLAPERWDGEQGKMGELVTAETPLTPRTKHGHTTITHLQPQPSTTNPTANIPLDNTKALETRNPNKKDTHNQTTIKRN